jgi:hypothetical protein
MRVNGPSAPDDDVAQVKPPVVAGAVAVIGTLTDPPGSSSPAWMVTFWPERDTVHDEGDAGPTLLIVKALGTVIVAVLIPTRLPSAELLVIVTVNVAVPPVFTAVGEIFAE